ncbi:MAG: DnaJ domain-containing protein [Pyrinomonadaceae bacterium]|nr:DnaJ domain-containing protein [Pyrinomonadaceae bacterium]
MNGKLSDRPLAELVHEISLKELSGTLRLEHESVKAAVYFDHGEVIYAASNLRELRLAEYLKKQGLVSEPELSNSGNRSDATFAAALVSRGVIDQPALEPVFTRQVGDILRVALLWAKGTWEFDDRSLLGDSVRVKLDIPALLLEAARRMQLELFAPRFPSDEELISPVSGLPNFNGLLPAEGFVISRVDVPIKLSELIALSGMGDLETKRTLYGLVLGGFMERAQKPNVLQARKEGAVRPRPVVPTVTTTPEPLPEVEASEETQRADLDAFLVRLDSATTHYEVLNVIASAPPERIKNSYYALARLYHPDKFHLQTSLTLHAHIESAFARITQAYETLMDPKRRSGYDSKLAALEKTRKFAQSAPKKVVKEASPTGASEAETTSKAGSDSERAENNFQEGYGALQQGDAKFAVTRLAAAARAMPQEARYRAYYGSALAADEDMRRLAETEMTAAIKLDPDNASYRVMLAELCFDLGFFKRAEGEVERATALEPNNAAARKLMQKLEAHRATR